MKVKKIKEADKKTAYKTVVHALPIESFNDIRSTKVFGLCGAPRDSKKPANGNISTYIASDVTCADCLVKLDQLLENGILDITPNKFITHIHTTPLYVVYNHGQTEVTDTDEYHDVELNEAFEKICLSTDNPYHKVYNFTDKVNVGEELWIAWCTYYSGDTFGSTGGNFEILEISKEQIELKDAEDYAHTRWNGYFEGVEEVYVNKVVVQKN